MVAVTDILETIFMVKAHSGPSWHTLLLPGGERLVSASGDDVRFGIPEGSHIVPGSLHLAAARDVFPGIPEESLTDPDEPYLQWYSHREKHVKAEATLEALWEILRVRRGADEEVIGFTKRWGILANIWKDDCWVEPFNYDALDEMKLATWWSFADLVYRLMTLLAHTAQGQVVEETFLESIQAWNEIPYLTDFGWRREPTPEEIQERWQDMLTERRQGNGLQQQRRLLAQHLSKVSRPRLGSPFIAFSGPFFGWNEQGRSVVHESRGLDEIVLSHIASVFLAPEIDALVCSVCGTPFPFDEASGARRPRFNVRQFCSDECRKAGKRESNRLSWRRNSSRWARKANRKGARGGSDEPAS